MRPDNENAIVIETDAWATRFHDAYIRLSDRDKLSVMRIAAIAAEAARLDPTIDPAN